MENKFKDWDVDTGRNSIGEFFGLCLFHYNCLYGGKNYASPCAKDRDGWYCIHCKTTPPKEVELFADLCYCNTLPNRGPSFWGRSKK